MKVKSSVLVLTLIFVLLGAGNVLAYNESPMLTKLVESGILPPVEERLPENPFVMDTLSDPKEARYGGTLRMVHVDPFSAPDANILNTEYIMLPPGHDGSLDYTGNMIPGIVESVTSNDLGTEFTFTLRKGMKWSDGHPLTTEDVRFTYEDILLNEMLTPVFPSFLVVDGEPCVIEILDEYTFKVTFAASYGGFIDRLATRMSGYAELIRPKHFFKKYHIAYTSIEEMKPELEAAELDGDQWWQLFNQVNTNVVGIPTLNAWVMVDRTTEVLRWERNPYYYRVDKAGNQLPYIDYLVSTLVNDTGIVPMKIVAGEMDFVRENVLLNQLGFYSENQERGNYRIDLYKGDIYNGEIFLNLSNPDPVWNQVINDIRFRQALNLAIDREEIIDSIHFGFATVSDRSPSIYDPALANKLLDEMGLDKRDAEGWRLGPDGQRFEIPFDVASLMGWELPMTELLCQYWEDIGIKTSMRTVTASLWFTIGRSNEIKATAHWNASNNAISMDRAYSRELMPDFIRSWGAGYRTWYDTNGKSGETPPEIMVEYFEQYDLANKAPEESQRQAAIDRMLEIIYDDLLWISLTWPQRAKIISNDLKNVPSGEASFDSFTPFFHGMQFYFAE